MPDNHDNYPAVITSLSKRLGDRLYHFDLKRADNGKQCLAISEVSDRGRRRLFIDATEIYRFADALGDFLDKGKKHIPPPGE